MADETDKKILELQAEIEKSKQLILALISCLIQTNGVLSSIVHRAKFDSESDYKVASEALEKAFGKVDTIIRMLD